MPPDRHPMPDRTVAYMRKYPGMRLDAIVTLVASELAEEQRQRLDTDAHPRPPGRMVGAERHG